MRNGVFPAISINKDTTPIISDFGPPYVNFWAWRAPGKNHLWTSSPQAATSPSGEQNQGCEKSNCRMLGPDSWDANKRNDFNKSRCLHLPIHRKALNSLTRDIWFSLANNYLLMFRLPGSCCKLLYNLIPSCFVSSEQFSQATWDAVSWTWSPKNSHQIKHNSPLLGCDYFLSQRE